MADCTLYHGLREVEFYKLAKKVICDNRPGFDQLNDSILQMLVADKLKAAIANSNDKTLNWPVCRESG